VFRAAEFTPAVFIPAHPPHAADQPAPPAIGDPGTQPAFTESAKAPARPWSHTMGRVAEELVAWMKTIVSAAVYATLIVTFGFQVARVEGQSMIPTLHDQDRLIVNKWIYRWHDPQPGDVVMLYYPEEPEKSFVKRVMAKEHDTIRSEYGKVYVNETLLSDEFIPEEYRSDDSWGPYVVKKGYYFVMGDHRNNSSDSRIWGEVPKKYIIGKVQIRWWPLDHMRIF
jgi:signal peptidase I